MAKPLFLPVTPILIPACLCRSHGLRFVYMYQQYMRRRHRKRHHYGFAGGIQALRAHVAEPLILPKNLKQKDFERFNQICYQIVPLLALLDNIQIVVDAPLVGVL
ncbi:uncharacterized protein LOC115963066 isoform X2 [Quercus lobata]|uniref:uncharacterized protein LOC115963066 isoform X2 n=1 Tax=Quercus lobata TaxID=97700 RepID=UPI001243A2F0|nr:uncharacterized protein LOC115963066 isoform X2 [Quercus lobata]